MASRADIKKKAGPPGSTSRSANIRQTIRHEARERLGHITASRIDQQFAFQELRNFYHRVVVLPGSFPEFAGIDGYTGVNIIVKGQDMSFVKKVPHEGIEIICLLGELDIEVVGENVGNFVEAF
jgi:hypothetical protein